LKKIPTIRFIPGIIWFFVVLITIIIPRNDIPKGSEWLDLILDFDKMIHAVMFGILALLFMYPFFHAELTEIKKKKIVLLIAVLTCAWGYITECIQLYVPGRSYDLVDWTADSIGCLFAWLIARKIPRINNKTTH
jgi:VanZ family protein